MYGLAVMLSTTSTNIDILPIAETSPIFVPKGISSVTCSSIGTEFLCRLKTGAWSSTSTKKYFPSLWQYGLWSFHAGGTKLERFLHKNQHTQRKLLNFEFWINGELSKIGHHFSNKVI